MRSAMPTFDSSAAFESRRWSSRSAVQACPPLRASPWCSAGTHCAGHARGASTRRRAPPEQQRRRGQHLRPSPLRRDALEHAGPREGCHARVLCRRPPFPSRRVLASNRRARGGVSPRRSASRRRRKPTLDRTIPARRQADARRRRLARGARPARRREGAGQCTGARQRISTQTSRRRRAIEKARSTLRRRQRVSAHERGDAGRTFRARRRAWRVRSGTEAAEAAARRSAGIVRRRARNRRLEAA